MTRRLLPLLLLTLLAAPAFAGEETPEDLLLEKALELIKDYEYRAAEMIYETVLAGGQRDFKALLGLARCASGVGEDPRAIECYDRAAKLKPEQPEPSRGMGHLAVRLDRRDEAESWYEKALALSPTDASSLAGLARVAIERRDFERASGLLDRAFAESPESGYVLSAKAELYFRTGDMTNSAQTLRKCLELSPKYLGAHLRLANGFLEEGREPYVPPEVPATYEAAVQLAMRAYRSLDLDEAERWFAELDDGEIPDGRPPFVRGLVHLRRGEPRTAIRHLWRAIEIEPGNLLFRNAFGTAYQMKIARQRAEYGGGGDGGDRIAPIVAALPVPEVPGVEQIVRGYERLTPAEQAVIRWSLAPLSRFIDSLIQQRVTHDILGLDERVCDAKERRYLNTRRTVDGRWYGGMRGLGGRNAATGLESVIAAGELRSNTFAHEIMHQVHRYGFSKSEKKVVLHLYRRAKAQDRCLDYYAASNEWEYLAQGYEAFVSPVKSPYHTYMARHTRAELKARDPVLYRFLLRVTGTEERDPALRPIAALALEFYEWAGDETALERARILFEPLVEPKSTPSDR